MRDEYGNSASSVFLSFILGGLVGAGVALLMAPRSGKETREKLVGMAEDAKGKATDYAGQVKEKISSTVEHGKEFVEGKKSLVSSAVEAGKEAYEKRKEGK